MYNYLTLNALVVEVILSLKISLQYCCVYRRANIGVFQALVFVLFVFSDFFIFCGANAGK